MTGERASCCCARAGMRPKQVLVRSLGMSGFEVMVCGDFLGCFPGALGAESLEAIFFFWRIKVSHVCFECGDGEMAKGEETGYFN